MGWAALMEMDRTRKVKKALGRVAVILVKVLAKESRLWAVISQLLEQSLRVSFEERRGSSNSRAWVLGSLKIWLGQ